MSLSTSQAPFAPAEKEFFFELTLRFVGGLLPELRLVPDEQLSFSAFRLFR